MGPSQVRRTPSAVSYQWKRVLEARPPGGVKKHGGGGPGSPAGVGASVAAAPAVARVGWKGARAGEWLRPPPDTV